MCVLLLCLFSVPMIVIVACWTSICYTENIFKNLQCFFSFVRINHLADKICKISGGVISETTFFIKINLWENVLVTISWTHVEFVISFTSLPWNVNRPAEGGSLPLWAVLSNKTTLHRRHRCFVEQ